MPGEPTLVELLEYEARHRLAGDCADHVTAARLRAAAARLRQLLEADAKREPTLVRGLLNYINGNAVAKLRAFPSHAPVTPEVKP